MRQQFASELAELDNELTEAKLVAAPYRQQLAEIEGVLNVKRTEKQLLAEKAQGPQKEADEIQTKLEIGETRHQENLRDIQERKQAILRDKYSFPIKECMHPCDYKRCTGTRFKIWKEPSREKQKT